MTKGRNAIRKRSPAALTRRALISGAAAVLAPLPASAQSSKDKEPDLDAPYVPTPQDVVDAMLELAQVNGDDFVMDLGCGDGRIVITAAKKYGARGYGVDIDPRRIVEAKANAAEAGVAGKVEFVKEDLFHTPIGRASVLGVYLFPHINELLAPRMLKEMKPGSRVVTHAFAIGKWRPDKEDMVGARPIHLFVIPAQVQGRWRVSNFSDGSQFTIDLIQSFQRITGSIEGRPGAKLRMARLAGADIVFGVEENGVTNEFSGTVAGDKIEGKAGGATVWSAVRI